MDLRLVEPPTDPVRVAVVGCGYWGPNLIRNFTVNRTTKLVAVCDRDADRLQAGLDLNGQARGYADLGDLLADPAIEAVAIATPPKTHAHFARRALQAGKHVLVEKPLATSATDATDLVRLASEAGRTLMVDHTYVYSPAVRRIKQLLDDRELGQLYYIDSVRINLGLFQNDVNVLWDLACHDLAIVDYLLGRGPVSLSAVGSSHTSSGLEDVAYLNLDYGGGLLANFHVNWLSPVKIRQFILGGSRRGLVFNELDQAEPIKVYDRGIQVGETPEAKHGALVGYRIGDIWSPHLPREEPLRNMVRHFADCVRAGNAPDTDGTNGARMVHLLEAAQNSIRANGARVPVAPAAAAA